MEHIVFREATVEDAKAIITLYQTIGKETDYFSFGSEGLITELQEQQDEILKTAKDPNASFLLVFLKNELIGYGKLRSMPRRFSHRAELAIAIKKAYWNNGIGKEIMKRLIHKAKNSGLELIDIKVRSDNERAIHVYRKFGFKTVGTVPAYIKIGDAYYDFDLMCLDLRQKNEE